MAKATQTREKGLSRFLKIDRSKIDKEKRTVELAFASETPVERWGENEVLCHEDGAFDFTRINDGTHPLMAGHAEWEPDDQIGVVERAWVDAGDKTSRAMVRFGNSPKAQEYFQDVQDGIRQNISVGYDRTGIVKQDKAADGMVTTRYKWMPTHIAIVPVPADTKAGVGRDNSETEIDSSQKLNVEQIAQRLSNEEKQTMRILLTPTPAAGGGGTATEENPVVIERNRVKEIRHISTELLKKRPEAREKIDELTNRALTTDMSIGDYQVAAMRECLNAKPAVQRTMASEGINASEYSIGRAIKSCVARNATTPDGFEGEVHQHFAARMSDQKPKGFIIPTDARIRPSRNMLRRMQRDLVANVFGAGGATVATELMVPIIEILRNRMKCFDFGVQTLTGLEGNVVIPRQTGAATAYSVAETQALTISTQTLDQIALTPRRVGAYNQYSKQLLLQSSIDVENFVRDDLMKVLAIDIDRIILNGQGGNSEPLGIMNTAGIGSVVLGGPATWGSIVSMETTVATSNADIGEMGYLTTPTAKGRLKTLGKLPVGANVVATETLWGGMLGDGSNDGEMNGYRAGSTNQIPNNQLLFGVFSQAILAMWGGYDVVVNPYSLDINAEVRITVNCFIDVAIRHPQSFCVTADSAAQ